jgi:hypothetical protein
MTPLRKKTLGVAPKMIHIDLIPDKQQHHTEDPEESPDKSPGKKGKHCDCLDCF